MQDNLRQQTIGTSIVNLWLQVLSSAFIYRHTLFITTQTNRDSSPSEYTDHSQYKSHLREGNIIPLSRNIPSISRCTADEVSIRSKHKHKSYVWSHLSLANCLKLSYRNSRAYTMASNQEGRIRKL